MEVVRLQNDSRFESPCVATIGFFDGVHRGHRYLISQVTGEARRLGMTSTVITFDRHPRQVVKTDFRPLLLSTFDEKMQQLATTGVDRCVVLPFDGKMAALSAHSFMSDILSRRLQVARLVIGYDNRFGHNRAEGFDDYVRYGREMNMEVEQARPFVLDGVNISSSVVRSLLAEGEVELAARCLGYCYQLEGIVETGEQIGRTIGFPTANLHPADACKIVPAHGVYAVWAQIDNEPRRWKAMLNIGVRPTFDGRSVTIETHLLHFSGDIYNHSLTLTFVSKIRDERRFHNGVELAAQLRLDAAETERILNQKEKTQ